MKVPAEYCVFEYLYRDASNYKAHGSLLLQGVFSEQDEQILRGNLDSSEYFVAEKYGIPTLYEELWQYSSGSNDDDHGFHEFVSFRLATEEDIKSMKCFGKLDKFLSKFKPKMTRKISNR